MSPDIRTSCTISQFYNFNFRRIDERRKQLVYVIYNENWCGVKVALMLHTERKKVYFGCRRKIAICQLVWGKRHAYILIFVDQWKMVRTGLVSVRLPVLELGRSKPVPFFDQIIREVKSGFWSWSERKYDLISKSEVFLHQKENNFCAVACGGAWEIRTSSISRDSSPTGQTWPVLDQNRINWHPIKSP